MRTHRALLAGAALLLPLAAGCGPDTDASHALENAMRTHITNADHRPVDSVSCSPRIHDTVRGQAAHLHCLVRFTDGTSYTAHATIQNQNSGGTHNLPDTYSWDVPPPPP
ncbi:hypothetical protein [Nocardia sp. BMG111209]|uniref:hypothetical protein n=1 Tax=Nocardia sp. BMG111209 TaxID=1160137 RepID=UPI000372B7E1|nr:hypothetical protein [Nocardia sp. BMG111209]